jgi:cobalamin biosynthesis protein CbiD
MGGSFSKSDIEVINNVNLVLKSNMVNRLIEQVKIQTAQLNRIRIVIRNGSVKLKNIRQRNRSAAYVAFDSVISALQKANAPTELVNKVKAMQEAKAGMGFAASINNQKVSNTINKYVNQKTLNSIDRKCRVNAVQSNILDFLSKGEAHIEFDGIDQVNETYNKCKLSALIQLAQDMNLPDSVINKMKNQASAKGFTLADMIGGKWAILIIGIVILVIGFFIYKFSKSPQATQLIEKIS